MYTILTINPGSTSTKIGLFQTRDKDNVTEIRVENIEHDATSMKALKRPIDQLSIRTECVREFIARMQLDRIDCVVSRGGILHPVEAGSYEINESMLADLRSSKYGVHASNTGGLVAKTIGDEYRCPIMIVDPIGVDEFTPLARYSGFPGIERQSQLHALNIRATAREVVKDLGLTFKTARLIVAHLGGGISVVPMADGKMLDVNNANQGGPFSPQRAGAIPTTQLVELAYSGQYPTAKDLIHKINRESGLLGYLGTDDGREIVRRIQAGDRKATEVFQAMAYQLSKEIGAMATVLSGKVDAIVITGGLARPPLTNWIAERTSWIAKNMAYPGEKEQQALAEAGARYLWKMEALKTY